MKTIVLASNNQNKVKEFKEILEDYDIITLKDIGYDEEIEETGETFLENALIKAKAVHQYLKEKQLEYIVVAEDSGLCVNSLGGAPGVYSARYAGGHSNDKANRQKLQQALLEKEDKSAEFVCCIVVYKPNGSYQSFEGNVEGIIIPEERGSKEFGYDCIFYSNDLQKTFGEATKEEKNQISHRGNAIRKMAKEL